jgi:two-component system, NtrC family, nitrogen regulation sensor histidine kinase GlnL
MMDRTPLNAEPDAAQMADATLNALPHPILRVSNDFSVQGANPAAEAFFETSLAVLRRRRLDNICGEASPLTGLFRQAIERGGAFNEYGVEFSPARGLPERHVDIFISPISDTASSYVIMLQERTIAQKMGRRISQQGAVRSVATLSAMLAHEIKNPLSGISGAAQLLEGSVNDDDRLLTRLIRDETARIVRLVDRFEMFSDARPTAMAPLNIHAILDHVKAVASSGFARGIRIRENYDPSLPAVAGNKDQLVQVFLNLVKNAAEAIGNTQVDGEIVLSTAYRPGVRMAVAGTKAKVSLPLEVSVRDNGPGVPPFVLPVLFDPFVTTKTNGSGLGLALVAKVIGDHGGTVECESIPQKTSFRVLLPMALPTNVTLGEA